MLKLRKLVVPLTIFALLVFLVFNLTKNPQAPNVTFTTIVGKKINMADLKGKVVLVNFWSTDCSVCVEEMPKLINTYNAHKDKGFEVIAIAMPYDPPAQVLNYATQKSLPFPVMHDGFSKITEEFGGVNLTPTAYIFDKHGNRIQYTIGKLDFARLNQLLDKELG
jgi:thiol-disulfide isomerase/thioredoxin